MRQISDEYNIKLTKLARAKQSIAQKTVPLEISAFDKLSKRIKEGTLIEFID